MNTDDAIKKIRKKAKADKRKRRDPRFLDTMGLLVAKGFLATNYDILPKPNIRINIDDAIWAGKNFEPRILEVLPAAVVRLKRHFLIVENEHEDLLDLVGQLKKREKRGNDFFGIEYRKLRRWAEAPLLDKRVKAISEYKIVKTFRLNPELLDELKKFATKNNVSETEALEGLVKSFLYKKAV